MFKSKYIDYIKGNKTPLNLDVPSFSDRKLILSKKSNLKRVVYFKNEFDNSTFRYRAFNVVQALSHSNEYEVTFFNQAEMPFVFKYIKNASLVILQRARLSSVCINLVALCKQNNIPVLYDMDDLFYKPEHIIQYMTKLGQPFDDNTYGGMVNLANTYRPVMEMVDGFIATTPMLAKEIENDFGKECLIIPNFYNIQQFNESVKCLKDRSLDESKFVIGYFSGSPTHVDDFKTIENDVLSLIKKHDDIYVSIVGFINLSPEFTKYINLKRVEFVNLVSYEDLQSYIATVDLNIVPLVLSKFNDAKSELKYFEASIVKVPSIMSPTSVYSSIINNGENGFLCKPGEWEEAIEKLYQSKNLRQSIANKAYNYCVKNYSPQSQIKRIEDTFSHFINMKKL